MWDQKLRWFYSHCHLEKLYSMIYALPLFKIHFQVFTPQILVDCDNFIIYIYNGQDEAMVG